MITQLKHTRNICLLICCIISSIWVHAQNDIQISYFMNNELAFNPSFAGSNEGVQASLLARKQWMSFEKAPLTQTLHVDYKSKIGGLGLYVINDGLGYEWSTHAKLLYAYHITIAEDMQLSAGLGAGLYNKQLDASEFVYQSTITDPNGIYLTENSLHPTIDVGVNLSYKNLVAGISSTHISNGIEKSDFSKFPRHYYGYVQYQHDLSNKIDLVPTLYIKSGGYITQFEGNCNVFFNNKYWLGATYRYNESAVILAGIIIQETIKIGYAYDYSIGEIKPHSNGNHEIILSIRMNADKTDKNYYQSTRLFN
ncbi:MAG: type IX secretion system membrane protein PorP/SprF [Bacteroidales bacterium]|jgi:type IX secretion system PorP/SprF family membrane protein|nr:type IX secretion system membrane protein PorP/SprF [Bacteroidales bacterium]